MAESIYDKKGRVRPPRVHITYEAETGGAMEMKELPFVMGVMSDLSGHPKESLPRLRDRKFVAIDRDNYNDVLKSVRPRLAMRVKNTLTDDSSELAVELNFESLDDFNPAAVARQVEPLKKLLDLRGELKDMLSRMEGNDRLESMLEEIIENSAVRDKLKDTLGVAPGGADGSEES
jgi:type VI secretion system protein ImpB